MAARNTGTGIRHASRPAGWPWVHALWWAWALVAPGAVLAAASVGTGGSAAAPEPSADVQSADRQQRARCQALQVTAVRAECLRQADRDLARRAAPARPAASAASTPAAHPR